MTRRVATVTICVLAAAVCAPAAFTGSASAASAGGERGAGVRSASLRQRGRRVFWQVALARGFSGASLRSGRRSVCLLFERRGDGRADGALCLTAPAERQRLGLSFARVRGEELGEAHPVAGRVRRLSSQRVLVSFAPPSLGRRWRPLRWQVQSVSAGSGGCGSRAGPTAKTGCLVRFPARRHPLIRLHTPRLVGCVARGPSIVYGGPPPKREIALTFDDGPWGDPTMMDFVDELHRLKARATFFEIGDQISEYDPTGASERAMLADGDMIGDHTWTHPNMDALAPAAQSSELELTAQAIDDETGFTPCLWRPPYGSIDSEMESLARSLGFLTVYWNDDPRDWSLPGTASIVATALREARDGGIVEMHFGGGPRQQTLDALPPLVAALRARGYALVNLAQMLGLREIWH